MLTNYYLLNGKKGKGHALNLLEDGNLTRGFIDISSLDLKTMDIPREEAREVLKEYNPDADLSGTFYYAQYPYKKNETKTFAPLFGFSKEESKYYMDHLRYFAEQRDFNKKRGNNVTLDDNNEFDKYVRSLMYRILSNRNKKLEDYESIIGFELKKIIKDRFEEHSDKSTESYMNSKINKIKKILSCYTQLRDITIEQIVLLEENKILSRTKINSFAHYDNYGLDPNINSEEKSDKQIKYYQMTLDDYMNKKKN